MSEFPLQGKCDNCRGEDFTLTRWGGGAYCEDCLVYKKAVLKAKRERRVKDDVQKFNALIRKTA